MPWIPHDLFIAWLPYYSESAGLPIDTVGTIDVDFKNELGTLRLVYVAKLIPAEILKDSVLLHLAAAYFSIGKRLEQKTQCSQTRGFVLSTLRGGAALNQNQIATLLGFDRTVVHRCIRSMIQEGLVSEREANSGRALLVQLTPKGTRYREYLIKARQEAEEKLRKELTSEECATVVRLLKVVAQLEL